MLSKHCPCCGEPIMAGQEECLNCRVYLLEVKKMATEKRLIDAIKHRLECHIAKAVYFGVDNIPTGKDSSSAFEFLRGYERGATETANIVLGMIPVDAVEVVHGRWDFCEPDSAGNRKPKCSVCGKYYLAWWSDYTHCNFCPNCGADMRGDGNG